MPHVNPTTPKIGQWNTTLSQTRRNKNLKSTYNYINIYTHRERQTRASVSTQTISVCQSRQCLVARLRPAFNTTTHIFLQHRHVPWTGTTGLRRKKKHPSNPSPLSIACHLASTPIKTSTLETLELFHVIDELVGKKAAPAVVFYSILQTCSDKTHTVNKKNESKPLIFIFFIFIFWKMQIAPIAPSLSF